MRDPFNGIAFPGIKREVREELTTHRDPYKALVRYLVLGKVKKVESDKTPVLKREDSCEVYWQIGRAIVELGCDKGKYITQIAKAAGYGIPYIQMMVDTYKHYPEGVPAEIRNTIELRERLRKYRDLEEGFNEEDCKTEAARLIVKFRDRFNLSGLEREQALEKMRESLKYPDPFVAFLSLMVKGHPIESAYVNAPEAPLFKDEVYRDAKAFKWHMGRAIYEVIKYFPALKFKDISSACGLTEEILAHYYLIYREHLTRSMRRSHDEKNEEAYIAACQELAKYAMNKGKPVPNKVIDTVAEAYGISPNGLKNHWANYCKENMHPSLQAVVEMYEQKVSELQKRNEELMVEIANYRERLARVSELLQRFESMLKIA